MAENKHYKATIIIFNIFIIIIVGWMVILCVNGGNFWLAALSVILFMFYNYSLIDFMKASSKNPEWCLKQVYCPSYPEYKKSKSKFYGGLSPCSFCNCKYPMVIERRGKDDKHHCA